MTDNEIVRAYEGLTPNQQLNLFRNLYYNDGYSTERGIIANAINDILLQYNRQKAEIEKLNDIHADMNESLRLAAEANKDMRAKVKKFADIGKMYSEVKAEAIKEFAERLCEGRVTKCKNCSFYRHGECWHGQWQDYEGNMPTVKETDFCSYGTPKERGADNG